MEQELSSCNRFSWGDSALSSHAYRGMHKKSAHTTLQPWKMISIITQSLTHSHSLATVVNSAVNFHDDRQSTHERTLRGGRTLLLSFSLCMSHFRFTVVSHSSFHSPSISIRSMWMVLVMPARPRFAISGILAGGIPGFGIATFLLGTSRFILWCCWLCPSVFTIDDLLRTGHTSCLFITFQFLMLHSTDWFWCFVFLCWLVLFLFGSCSVLSVFALVFACPALEWHHTAGHYNHMKPATVSASFAVISTASKYLHNDLARAIKALEQKKLSILRGSTFGSLLKYICFAQGSKTGSSAFWIRCLPGSLFDVPFKYSLKVRCWNLATNISVTHHSN